MKCAGRPSGRYNTDQGCAENHLGSEYNYINYASGRACAAEAVAGAGLNDRQTPCHLLVSQADLSRSLVVLCWYSISVISHGSGLCRARTGQARLGSCVYSAAVQAKMERPLLLCWLVCEHVQCCRWAHTCRKTRACTCGPMYMPSTCAGSISMHTPGILVCAGSTGSAVAQGVPCSGASCNSQFLIWTTCPARSMEP